MRPLARRTLLKGLGASLALPALDAMLPRHAWATPEVLSPTRMAFVFFPNGVIVPDWRPQTTGADYELPRTLKVLAEHREDFLVLSGLAHDKARANGDGAGDHARCVAAFLTGAQPRKTDGADIQVGQSIDQFAAERIGQLTRLPSLELGIEPGRQAGKCDSGYSCAYQSNVSWKSATTPTGKETRPRAVFERLFGGDADPRVRAERAARRKSILDFVSDDAEQLNKRLGGNDRRKLDEYLTSVREVELRVTRPQTEPEFVQPHIDVPEGVPQDFQEHVRLMFDLLALAFETDSTRIATFMIGNCGSNRTYKEIGVPEAHHQLSHHVGDPDKIASLQKIDEYLLQQYSYFLSRMKNTREGNGSLLDHSMVLYGCSISDANRHSHHDLPILLAGRGNGTLAPGRHVEFERDTPMCNLFLSLLDRMGVDANHFGDSTGRVGQLS